MLPFITEINCFVIVLHLSASETINSLIHASKSSVHLFKHHMETLYLYRTSTDFPVKFCNFGLNSQVQDGCLLIFYKSVGFVRGNLYIKENNIGTHDRFFQLTCIVYLFSCYDGHDVLMRNSNIGLCCSSIRNMHSENEKMTHLIAPALSSAVNIIPIFPIK